MVSELLYQKTETRLNPGNTHSRIPGIYGLIVLLII